MWTAFKILAGLAACYMAVVAWVYVSQRRMLYMPSQTEIGTPQDVGMPFKNVWLRNSQGTDIHGWHVPHESPRFTVLFSHGNAGNVSHRLASIKLLRDLGLSVFVYDYSGYGKSRGTPSEQATRADAMAAWEWLVHERKIPQESVLLFGRSLGGAVSARLASDLHERGQAPAGMVLESTFTSVPDMGAHLYPWLPVRLLAKYRYDSERALASLSLPILFAHSPDDEIIPYSLGKKLYESYDGPKRFLKMQGDHNTGYVLMEEAYPAELDRFLRSLED